MIILVDTDGICPKGQYVLRSLKLPQRLVKVFGHLNDTAVKKNRALVARITPVIGQCSVFWSVVERRAELIQSALQ